MAALLSQRQCLVGSCSRSQNRTAVLCGSFDSIRQQRRLSRSTPRRRVTTMGLFGLGLPEVAVVAGIAVLVFGPSKLPELGKELGKTVKSFQTAAKEFETELKNAADETTDKIEEKTEKLKDDIKK